MSYTEFLQQKEKTINPVGITVKSNQINKLLFDFQKDIVIWAVKMGRCAVFADTGLGKTFIQLEWGRLIGGNI